MISSFTLLWLCMRKSYRVNGEDCRIQLIGTEEGQERELPDFAEFGHYMLDNYLEHSRDLHLQKAQIHRPKQIKQDFSFPYDCQQEHSALDVHSKLREIEYVNHSKWNIYVCVCACI